MGSSALRLPALAVLVLTAGLLLAPAARAQQDIQPLLDRIDRLERDVNLLQRQVYRGTTPGGAPMPVTPPEGPGALSSDVRMDQIEDEMRQLTGQVQDLGNAIDQLKHRLDTMSSDIDQRFAALQPGAAGAAAPAAMAAGPGASPPAAAPSGPPVAATSAPSAASGVLGTIHSNEPPAHEEAAAPADLPTGTPSEQYNKAFGALRSADYPNAEKLLKNFVEKYPADPLAPNAQYWLGQVYYVQKNYQNAATAFAVGYQKYPKGPKAAETLLSLGMSLGKLGKKQDACVAFARLDRDFPGAAPNIKDREASARQELACT
jgi:tol-pal system protein YbgF